MRNVLAMVLAAGRVDELSVLTINRPKSAIPFGGLYRVIDFALSNLMHSGIDKVGILSQYRPFSLMNHIGNGAAWDLHGRHSYVHILPPYTGNKPLDWYRGPADAIYQNIDYIQKAAPDYVMVLSGDHIYQMNYSHMLDFHRANDADVTVAFKEMPIEQCSRFGLGHFDKENTDTEGGPLIKYTEKPEDPKSPWASLTVYIFKPAVLFEILEEIVGRQRKSDFGRDVFPDIIKDFRVFGYKHQNFWGYTRTITEYYRSNMSLLGDQPEIDPEQWKIRTNLSHRHIQDRLPSVFGHKAEINNSLIYNGSRIRGKVENSILFSGVEVEEGVEIYDSIVSFDTKIAKGTTIHRSIIDSDVNIGRYCRIGGVIKNADRYITEYDLDNELTLVGQESHVPDFTEILKGVHYLGEAPPPKRNYGPSPKEVV